MNRLKIIIIFLLFFIYISRSQIISNNDFFKIYDYSSNEYSKYSTNSTCLFNLNYYIHNQSEINIVSKNPQLKISNGENIFNYNIQITVSSLINFNSLNFDVYDYQLVQNYTNFTINVFCEDINYELIQVTPLIKTPIEVKNFYYTYILIKGLKYTSNNLNFQSQSLTMGITPTIIHSVTNEIYRIDLNVIDPLNIIDKNITLLIFKKTVVFDPILLSSSTQEIKFIKFKSPLNSYSEYGYNFSPTFIFGSNITLGNKYLYFIESNIYASNNYKRIGQTIDSNGNLSYTYIIPFNNLLSNSQFNCTMEYNYKHMISFKTFQMNDYNDFQWYQVPRGSIYLNLFNGFTVSTNYPLTSNQTFRNSQISHSFYNFKFISTLPFGFHSGNLNTSFSYKVTYPLKTTSLLSPFSKISIYEYPGGFSKTIDYTLANTDQSVFDTMVPEVLSLELKQIRSRFLLTLNINETSSIGSIVVCSNEINGYSSFVKGNYSNGIYEIVVDLNCNIIINDIYYNSKSIDLDRVIYINSDGKPIGFNYPFNNPEFDIQFISYAYNDMDILNKPFYNTLYFNSSTIPTDYPLKLRLLDDVTVDGKYNSKKTIKQFPVFWDSTLKLFYCNFIVPKNTNHYFIPYQIESPLKSIDSSLFPPLRVSKTLFDNDGPIITKIESFSSSNRFGWTIEISDEINGFDNGFIKVIGSVDSSIYKINFTLQDSNPGSTIYFGIYEIILNNTNGNSSTCFKQEYIIDTIYLEDSNGIYSFYSRFDSRNQKDSNPLRNFLENGSFSSSLKTFSNCLNFINDLTPPILISFSYDEKFNTNMRTINFTFTAKDSESGFLISDKVQQPIVYLLNLNMELLECESHVIYFNFSHRTYYCEIEIPYGFAFPGSLLLSVYGFVNGGGTFSGFSTDDLNSNSFDYQIAPFMDTTKPILTGYEPFFFYSKEDIIVYGKGLSKTFMIRIEHHDDFSNYSTISFDVFGETALKFKLFSNYNITTPINITVFTGNLINQSVSNTLTLFPTYFNTSDNVVFTPTQSPSSTPIPTNSPQKCFGTPVCGGPTNGYCNVNTGCVCYSPFVGIDCSSQIIIVPPPKINNTNPTTEIPINENGSNNNGTDSSSVFYKSLISLYAIRELSIDQKEINKYEFNKWLYNEIDNSTHQYFTNITTRNNNNIFNITVTLKWFTNETTIEFANQNLLMNPSSMKYTIEISNYQFKSKLNSLQLIMFASFDSNQTSNTCSSKQFGDTSSGDNSNYLKIQIENKSLYGRFIKRGIIDNSNIVSLSNQLLDDELNSIESSHQIQSFIGITLPYFNQNAIIDPDFSVLVDSKTADSICDNKSSKLSGTQIAGIVIGCVVFFCAVVVSVVYVIYKTKKQKKLMKNIGNKLKNLN